MSHRLLAAGTVMALSLTGCAGQAATTAIQQPSSSAAPSVSPSEALGQAVQKADAVSTVNMSFNLDGSMPQGQKLHLIGRGQLQLRPTFAEGLTMNVTTQSRSVPIQLILWGDAIYVKSPMTSKVAGGKPWLKLTVEQLDTMTGMNLDAILKQAQQTGPAEQIKMLTASKDLKQVGTGNIGGVPATHYAGTLTVQEALSKLSSDAQASLQKVFQRIGVTPSSTINIDLWVDHQSLPRKLVSKLNTSNGPLTKTVIYTGYNRPFAIQTPRASQVGEFSGTAVPMPPGSAAPS